MSEAKTESSGTWRKGEFVRWQDIFIPVEAFLVWAGIVVFAMAVGMAVSIALHVPKETLTSFTQAAPKSFGYISLVTASLYIVLLFFLWRIARRVSGPALVARFRGISPKLFFLIFAGGIAFAFLVMFVNWELASHVLVKFRSSPSEQAIAPNSLGELPLALFSIALIAPLVEEFYFRGIVLSWLARKMYVPLAALLSAVIFGLFHLRFVAHQDISGWYFTGVIGLLGLLNAILAIKTRSLWAPFALHASYNATLISAPLLLRATMG